jgi:Cupin-like domain
VLHVPYGTGLSNFSRKQEVFSVIQTPMATERLRTAKAAAGHVDFDPETFDPMRVMPVRHNLEHHPLLQLPAVVDLAQRLSNVCTVRFHDDRATPGTSFIDAPKTNPISRRPEEIVASIESAHAWLALLGVHKDPAYRALLDEVLESVRPVVDRTDPGMSYRRADIFVASPGAVTPYHLDHEHNFILQVRGEKLLNVCEPLDREVVTEQSLELFHATGSRELVVYRDEFTGRAHQFELEPGRGGYMPTTAPHWVKNGDNVSITISFTYYTRSLRRRELLHRGNYQLRRLGLRPTPVGQAPGMDRLKHAAFTALFGLRDVAAKGRGRHVEDFTQYYGN